MKSTFNRDYNLEVIRKLSKLSKENDYMRCIFEDAKQGRTFLAFRPDAKASFYIQGRNMCDLGLESQYEPTIETKYLPVLRSDKSVNGRITEDKWKEKIGTSKYSWGNIYTEIVDNLLMQSDKEALQVSDLYRFSPLAGGESKILLIDIESKFSYPCEDGITKPDLRIDVVLYNLEKRQLIFLEVKRLSDDRLQKKGEIQCEIIHQLESYKELIKSEKKEIITEFNKTLEVYSEVSGIQMRPIDEDAEILLGLLVTEYNKADETIVRNLSKGIEAQIKVPVIFVGSISSISTSTIEKKWYPKLSKKR